MLLEEDRVIPPAHEWNEAYVLGLSVGEFDWLEVKGRRALDLSLPQVQERDVLQNLSRSLSALANSGGGMLIYGLLDPTTAGHKWMVDDGGVSTAIKGDTREWLENVIPHQVDYPLTTFNVYAILPSSDSSLIHPGRALYVIEVADSPHAPHQAFDNKYYIRLGGKSRPIPHRLVLDIMGRRQHPQIELHLAIIVRKLGVGRRVILQISARNTGRIYANYVNCIVYLPLALARHRYTPYGQDTSVREGQRYFVLRKANTRRDVVGTGEASTLGPSWFDPILPDTSHTWRWDLPGDFQVSEVGQQVIHWEIFADNAPKQRGAIPLEQLDIVEQEERLDTFFRGMFKEEPRLRWLLIMLLGILLFTQVLPYLFRWLLPP